MNGIANIAVVPVRAEASERAEMTTQILWGETFEVLKQETEWLQIALHHDKYRGWVPARSVQLLGEKASQYVLAQPYQLCTALSYATNTATGQRTLLPHGAVLYNYNQSQRSFCFGKTPYRLLAELPAPLPAGRECVAHAALQLLNAPYLWGGRTALGIDCSGLVQLAFRFANIALPRDAWQQATLGTALFPTHDARVGDLAFFGTNKDRPAHVGIVYHNSTVLHASGKVRLDKWDTRGIYNADQSRYTHQLIAIRQIIKG